MNKVYGGIRLGLSKYIIMLILFSVLVISIFLLYLAGFIGFVNNDSNVKFIEEVNSSEPTDDENIEKSKYIDLSEFVRLKLSYQVVKNETLVNQAYELLKIAYGEKYMDNLTKDDIAVIEIYVEISNVGEETFYRRTNSYCMPIPGNGNYSFEANIKEKYSYFMEKIDFPISALDFNVKRGDILGIGMLCTLDLTIYPVEPGETQVNKYVYIIRKPFEAQVKISVEVLPDRNLFPSIGENGILTYLEEKLYIVVM